MAPPSHELNESDFAAIESVIKGTERGRLFLAEVGRRRRADDAARILAAIERIEARMAHGDSERARQRLESERAKEIVGQLAVVLKDLRPLADAQVRARTLAARDGAAEGPAQEKSGGLKRRFAALVELDGQALHEDVKLFG